MADLKVTELLSLANSRHRTSIDGAIAEGARTESATTADAIAKGGISGNAAAASPRAYGARPLAERDDLAVPEEARAFLESEAVPVPAGLPSEAQLGRLREIRDLGHDILEMPEASWRERLADAARKHLFRFDGQGNLTPAEAGWDGFAASFVPLLFELDRQRGQLRYCANPTCHWLFADRSKNHSRVWCSMGTCGSRAKMSRYRSRRRRGATESAAGAGDRGAITERTRARSSSDHR